MSKKKEWRKSFTGTDGKRHYVRANSQGELYEKLMQTKNAVEEKERCQYDPTVNTYYERFTEIRRREIRESTIRAQRSQYTIISNVIMPNGITFGELRIKAVTRHDIEYVRTELCNAGKTPQNLNNCFAHLNHVFHTAAIDDIIVKNPCRELKQLKRTQRPARETIHRALTEQETKAFFTAAAEQQSYYYNAFRLMLLTGMRIGEISALYRTDIDTKNECIHVRRTITRNEYGKYIVGENAKTESGMREIPLTDAILDCIHKQEELNMLVFGNDAGLLYRSATGEVLREYCCNREINRICKKEGIEKFTCHAFRATFATRFIEQRPHDYKILSEILGHKSTDITLNLYTHVMKENKHASFKAVNIAI